MKWYLRQRWSGPELAIIRTRGERARRFVEFFTAGTATARADGLSG